MSQLPELLELFHPSDPRFLMAPIFSPPPPVITSEDLRERRWGKLLIVNVGTVVAKYENDELGNWNRVGNND